MILIDRGVFDGLFLLKLFYEDNRCDKKQYDSMKNFLLNCIPILPDILFVYYTSIEEAIARKLNSGNSNTDSDFIELYNRLLLPFYDEIKSQGKKFLDTSKLDINKLIQITEEYISDKLSL